MISKCANPKCGAEFRHSDEGRLFPFEIRGPVEPCVDVPAAICEKTPDHATVYFWLCGGCCHQFTLQFTVETGVKLIPLRNQEHVSPPSAA